MYNSLHFTLPPPPIADGNISRMVKDVDTFSLFPSDPPSIAQDTFYAVRTLYFTTFQLAWVDGNLSYLIEKE